MELYDDKGQPFFYNEVGSNLQLSTSRIHDHETNETMLRSIECVQPTDLMMLMAVSGSVKDVGSTENSVSKSGELRCTVGSQ
eukprot:4719994-Amphidinium_carterae.1